LAVRSGCGVLLLIGLPRFASILLSPTTPAFLINRQHVITHQGFNQLIGGLFGRVLAGGHHQQIGIAGHGKLLN
jgi:hypothetical protein